MIKIFINPKVCVRGLPRTKLCMLGVATEERTEKMFQRAMATSPDCDPNNLDAHRAHCRGGRVQGSIGRENSLNRKRHLMGSIDIGRCIVSHRISQGKRMYKVWSCATDRRRQSLALSDAHRLQKPLHICTTQSENVYISAT